MTPTYKLTLDFEFSVTNCILSSVGDGTFPLQHLLQLYNLWALMHQADLKN